MTFEFTRDKVKFILEKKLISKSPDAVPTDYFVWDYLKQKLREKGLRYDKDFKHTLKEIRREFSQELINKN